MREAVDYGDGLNIHVGAGEQKRERHHVVRTRVGIDDDVARRRKGKRRHERQCGQPGFVHMRVTCENPSSISGGSSFAAIANKASSGTFLARARLRSRHTASGAAKYTASISHLCQRAISIYGFRSARVRWVASMHVMGRPMASRWRSRYRNVAKTRA